MATKTKKPAAPAAQTEDNYELPSVTDASTKPSEPEAPVVEEVAVVDDGVSLDDHLDAAHSESAQAGSLGFELNICIARYKQDREKHRAETKYRLECLRADADDEHAAKIDAILAKL